MNNDCSNCLYGMENIAMQSYCNETEWVDEKCDGWKMSLEVENQKLKDNWAIYNEVQKRLENRLIEAEQLIDYVLHSFSTDDVIEKCEWYKGKYK